MDLISLATMKNNYTWYNKKQYSWRKNSSKNSINTINQSKNMKKNKNKNEQNQFQTKDPYNANRQKNKLFFKI